MQIQKIQLKNFKRFTDLTIERIPENTKLVLLIGSNGSGKSCVFDAFEVLNSSSKNDNWIDTTMFSNYYQKKDNSFSIAISTPKGDFGIETRIDGRSLISVKLENINFYGRSSFRQLSRLTKTVLGNNLDTQKDADRPRFYIDRDERFENDIEKMTEDILKNVFLTNDSGEKIRQKYIQPINDSLKNIFTDENNTGLELIEIIPPLEGKTAQINFKKGNSTIHYNLLSAGEKEIVNILVNLLSRKELLENAILFFDEMDLHLNTSIQFNLLKEITEKWIPDNSQLWTASHALGFIDYARKTENAAIIDFDLLNFDFPQTLSPEPKENLDVYEIAIPKDVLFGLLSGKKLVVCENKNDEYYNLLNIKDTIFVGQKDSRAIFLEIKRDKRYHSLRDRDFLSDNEINRIKNEYPNHHILRYYDFENYIYHPENIAEIAPQGFVKSEYISEIIKQKNERLLYILPNLASSRQNYEEFKTENIKDKDTDAIVDDFKTDNFEQFYKFFDMKDQFNKSYLAKFNLSKEALVKTKWFKKNIEIILNS